MSSSFADPFDKFGADSPAADYDHPFAEGYYDSHVPDSPSPINASGGALPSGSVSLSPEIDVNGPILPPPSEMDRDEGYALREWRRQNAIRLEEKEKREKELMSQIIVEADEYKVEFHRKRQITSETNKLSNREKEKIFVSNQVKFHAEADKDYWKSIAELIPKEVPAIERRKGKKEQEKKPFIAVIQGPKSGKPTDLSRMRHLLTKLKHNTPQHLKTAPPLPPNATADDSAAAAAAAMAVSTEAVVAA